MPETIIIPPIIAYTQDVNVIDIIEAFFERKCVKEMKQDGYKMYINFVKIQNPDANTVSKVRNFVAGLSKYIILYYKNQKYVLTTQYLDL
jgi:hypothetical protein